MSQNTTKGIKDEDLSCWVCGSTNIKTRSVKFPGFGYGPMVRWQVWCVDCGKDGSMAVTADKARFCWKRSMKTVPKLMETKRKRRAASDAEKENERNRGQREQEGYQEPVE